MFLFVDWHEQGTGLGEELQALTIFGACSKCPTQIVKVSTPFSSDVGRIL